MAAIDWVVIVLYGAAVAALGVWAGRQEKTTTDFFLAGRSMSWFPTMISSLATGLSALTFIGVPGAAYGGNFIYLQLWVGTMAGQLLLAGLFLPAFYRLKVTTVYELLGHRFGGMSRTTGTLFFIVSRILASGVRLAGCAIAVSVFFGLSLHAAILLTALFAVFYTASGGIKAVIWTDMLQFFLFMGAALVAIALIWTRLPDGFSQFVAVGQAHDKFRMFNFAFSLDDATSFWSGNLFALVIGVAVGATDQDIAQRLLTCRSVGQAQKAAIGHGLACFGTSLLFLVVGASLFAYFQVFPDESVAGMRSDWIFPHFIRNVVPIGLRGLFVAGLLAAAMSSMDSALNGLASTAYVDIYLPFLRRRGRAADGVKVSRILVVAFAVVLAGTAMIFGQRESILWFGLQVMGYTYGALLGVFLLAVLTKKRGAEIGNVVAMASSILVVLFFTADFGGALAGLRSALLSPLGISKFAWPWAIAIGTAWTFGVGFLWPVPRRTR